MKSSINEENNECEFGINWFYKIEAMLGLPKDFKMQNKMAVAKKNGSQ